MTINLTMVGMLMTADTAIVIARVRLVVRWGTPDIETSRGALPMLVTCRPISTGDLSSEKCQNTLFYFLLFHLKGLCTVSLSSGLLTSQFWFEFF